MKSLGLVLPRQLKISETYSKSHLDLTRSSEATGVFRGLLGSFCSHPAGSGSSGSGLCSLDANSTIATLRPPVAYSGNLSLKIAGRLEDCTDEGEQ